MRKVVFVVSIFALGLISSVFAAPFACTQSETTCSKKTPVQQISNVIQVIKTLGSMSGVKVEVKTNNLSDRLREYARIDLTTGEKESFTAILESNKKMSMDMMSDILKSGTVDQTGKAEKLAMLKNDLVTKLDPYIDTQKKDAFNDFLEERVQKTLDPMGTKKQIKKTELKDKKLLKQLSDLSLSKLNNLKIKVDLEIGKIKIISRYLNKKEKTRLKNLNSLQQYIVEVSAQK